jgi:hypothetical protein
MIDTTENHLEFIKTELQLSGFDKHVVGDSILNVFNAADEDSGKAASNRWVFLKYAEQFTRLAEGLPLSMLEDKETEWVPLDDTKCYHKRYRHVWKDLKTNKFYDDNAHLYLDLQNNAKLAFHGGIGGKNSCQEITMPYYPSPIVTPLFNETNFEE